MLCSQARRGFHSYAAGDTKGFERLLIKQHLDSCPFCRAEYERMTEIKSILSNMGRSIEAPYGLIADIMDSIDLQKYKYIGLYAVNNIRNLGLSLIAAGLIIAVFSLFPQMEQSMDMKLIGKSMIKPFKIINDSVIDISHMISDFDEAISVGNE